jgi:hypothetical protein
MLTSICRLAPLSRRTASRLVLMLLLALGVLGPAAPGYACVFISGFVADFGPGEAPIVCENIWWNGGFGAAARFDYQFFVASGGPNAIDFFGFGIGAPPAAVTSTNGGTTVFGNFSFHPVLPVTAQANVVFTTNGAPFGWAFDEYTGVGGYFVDWNDIGTGVLPGNAALNVNNNPGSIAAGNGSFGVFNAFSPFGPVPGFAVVDPPPSGPIFEIGFGNPDSVENLLTLHQIQGVQVGPDFFCTAPGQTIEGESPCTDPAGNPVLIGDAVLPEPSSLSLVGLALVALAAFQLGRRQSRSAARNRA